MYDTSREQNLLDGGSTRKEYELFEAVFLNLLFVVKRLVEKEQIHPNFKLKRFTDHQEVQHFNISPLHIAIEKQYLKSVQYLLEHGANMHSIMGREGLYRQNPMAHAISIGNINIIKKLQAAGANYIFSEELVSEVNALFMAIGKDSMTLVEFLLEQQPSLLNEYDMEKGSALHVAIYYGRIEIFSYLLKCGISRSIIYKQTEETLLEFANREGAKDIVNILNNSNE